MKKGLVKLIVATALLGCTTGAVVSCNQNTQQTTGKHYEGATVPPEALGVNGDTYTNTLTGENYKKVNGKWVLQEDGGPKSYSGTGDPDPELGKDGDKYTNNVNGAIWTKQGGVWVLTTPGDITYVVTFDLDGGTIAGSTTWPSQTVREGRWASAPGIDPVKDKCTFKGWYRVGAETAFDFATGIYGNIDLVAKWNVNEESKITVTVDPQNGSGTYTKETFEGDYYYPEVPSKPGYAFTGWVIDGEAYNGKVTSDMNGKTITATYEVAQFNMEYKVEQNGEVTITGILDIESVVATVPSQINGRNVTKIAKNAFNSRVYLTTIYIPATVKVIEDGAFRGTSKLVTINVDSANPNYVTKDGILYTKDMKTLVCYPMKAGSSFTVPSTITKIGAYAFYDTKDCGISSITFNEGLVEIGEAAFYLNETIQTLVFPSTLKKIGARAFYGSVYADDEDSYISPQGVLQNVTFNEGLEEIGDMAFANQYFQDTFTLPSTVKKIGDYAFVNCNAITKFIFPKSLEELGYNAFAGATGILDLGIAEGNTHFKVEDGILYDYDMKTLRMCPSGRTELVEIPEGVTKLGDCAFYMVDELNDYSFPSTLVEIGEECFAQTYHLNSLVIPDSVTKIGDDCFYESGISSVTLSANLIDLGAGAFSTCGLTSVEIPASLKEIKEGTFEFTSIKTVTLNEGLESIGNGAFYSAKVTELAMPKTLKTIGDRAFYGCSISELNIGESLESIGYMAFSNTSDTTTIQTITVDAKNVKFAVKDGFLMNKAETEIFFASLNVGSEGAVTIPNTVKKIGDYAFACCKTFTSIDLGTGVEEIGEGAFEFTKFKEITFPASLKTIGEGAFYMTYLTTVHWNEGLETIGAYAFTLSDIVSAELPNSVKRIEEYAFKGMLSLTSLTLGNQIEYIGDHAFSDNKISNAMTIPASVTHIGEGAFNATVSTYGQTIPYFSVDANNQYYTTNVAGDILLNKDKTVVIGSAGGSSTLLIPSTVTEIANYGLANCKTTATSLVLPQGLTKIGEFGLAFLKVSSLTVGSGVTYIGKGAFAYYTSSQTISFQNTRDYCLTNYDADFLLSCNAKKSFLGE